MSLLAHSISLDAPDWVTRGYSRARLHLPARLVTFGGTAACTLIDLSRSGAKLAAAECPRVGSMVVVEGLALELFGTVRWAAGGAFGIAFDTAIPLERVIALRHYADGEAERQMQAQLTHAREWVQGVF